MTQPATRTVGHATLMRAVKEDPLLTPEEVALLFSVTAKTVSKWAKLNKFGEEGVGWIRTLGGHRRFRTSHVLALRNRTESSDSE